MKTIRIITPESGFFSRIKNKKNYRGYNPFKLWGSYVGAFIYLILTFFGNKISDKLIIPLSPFLTLVEKIADYLNPCIPSDFFSCFLHNLGILIFTLALLSLIFGFLVGWLIHSLVRFLKNRRK